MGSKFFGESSEDFVAE